MDENEYTSTQEAEEVQETTAPAEADEAVEEAWNAADQPRETGGETEEIEGKPTVAQAEDGMELKYMGELRRVGREEAVTLAQKGMDYERIRAERDELRSFRMSAAPAAELVDALAVQSGMSTEDYLEHCRRELPSVFAGETGQSREETVRTQRKEREVSDFLSDFPNVKPEEIPGEVWEQVAAGKSLSLAYSLHRSKSMERELSAKAQDQRNRQRTAGTLSRSAPSQSGDLISMWWNAEA